jgi:hypothetical protein
MQKNVIFANQYIIYIDIINVFYGTANRKKSEEFGCWVYLCAGHHNMTDYSVHFNKELDLKLKKECQKEFEKYGSREDFRRIFGKSYL